jgi:hypothetical protein
MTAGAELSGRRGRNAALIVLCILVGTRLPVFYLAGIGPGRVLGQMARLLIAVLLGVSLYHKHTWATGACLAWSALAVITTLPFPLILWQQARPGAAVVSAMVLLAYVGAICILIWSKSLKTYLRTQPDANREAT